MENVCFVWQVGLDVTRVNSVKPGKTVEGKASMTETNDTEHMHIPVANQLAVDIIDGKWAIGTATTLEDMQSRFDISRTVAREASRHLEAAGAITIRRRVGLVAQDPKSWQALNPQVIAWKLHSSQRKQELLALTELRLSIEPAAARYAAVRASLEDKAKLPVMALQMKQLGEQRNLAEFHKLDIEFHRQVLRCSGNELFAAFADTVATVLRGRVEINMYPQQPAPEALRAHVAVGEAILNGDADGAYEAMREIVDEVDEALRGNPLF